MMLFGLRTCLICCSDAISFNGLCNNVASKEHKCPTGIGK